MIVNGEDKSRVERGVDQAEEVSLWPRRLIGGRLVEMQDIVLGYFECGSVPVVRHVSCAVEEDGLVSPVTVEQKLKGAIVS